jgi:hypothetical protein
MTRTEIALLLGLMAGRDRRTVGESDVLAWFQDVGDLDFADAREAVSLHYRESTEFMMPAHLRQRVREVRDARRRSEHHEVLALPSKFEDDISRDARLKAGMQDCREVLGPIMERLAASRAQGDEEEPDRSELIRQRALEVARGSRKGRRS